MLIFSHIERKAKKHSQLGQAPKVCGTSEAEKVSRRTGRTTRRIRGNDMIPITQDKPREIVEDFRRAIGEKKTRKAKPARTVINFRDEKRNSIERQIEVVPIDLLRYRKDNGRIASDVMNYERLNGHLDEKDKQAQEVLRDFLKRKDPEKTHTLIKSIEHAGQNEPAIITCDGFLINGNRRKMALEDLRERNPGKPEYESMKVVILPGPGEEGGPPTLLDIEHLENRYQLQSEGKSEYYGFDRALSIKRKIELGFSLAEQLGDDPRYARATRQELDKPIKECERDYLYPLACVERYLAHLDREELYEAISSRVSDREGRWQAFIDYSKSYHSCLTNKQWQIKNDFDEEDVGAIEDVAFKMIRLRTLKGLPKIHQLMRKLPKMCALLDSRKEILSITNEVDSSLPKEQQFDADGNALSTADIDAKWADLHRRTLIHRTKKAMELLEESREKETPMALLEAALKKLTHESLSIDLISQSDYPKARKCVSSIQKRAGEIEHDLYDNQKNAKGRGRRK